MSIEPVPLRTPVRLLTPEEAADLLGCGRSHMYRLISAGEIRSVKVGRLRRIPSTEVESYIDSLMAPHE